MKLDLRPVDEESLDLRPIKAQKKLDLRPLTSAEFPEEDNRLTAGQWAGLQPMPGEEATPETIGGRLAGRKTYLSQAPTRIEKTKIYSKYALRKISDYAASLVTSFEKGLLLGYTPVTGRYKYEPKTKTEQVLGFAGETTGFTGPLVLGVGAVEKAGGALTKFIPALSKLPAGFRVTAKGAALGGLLGGLQKPEEGESRLKKAGTSAALFGVLSAGGYGLQKTLAKSGAAKINRILEAADTAQKQITQVGKYGGVKHTDILKSLKSLSGQEQSAVINILKHRHGMPVEPTMSWYSKHVGTPMYNKIISRLENWKWGPAQSVKKALVYRYGQPKEWADQAEKRLLNIALGSDKASNLGRLLSDKLDATDAEYLLKDMSIKDPELVQKLVRPTVLSRGESQRVMQLIKGGINAGSRPDLAARAQIARQEIDALSKEILQLPIPEQTKETVVNNMGTYVRRLYRSKEGKGVLGRFFTGFRSLRLRGKKTFLKQRAKGIKQAVEKDFTSRISVLQTQHDKIGIGKIEGVGPIVKERLRRAGFTTPQRIAEAKFQDLASINMDVETLRKLQTQANVLWKSQRSLQGQMQELNSAMKFRLSRADIPALARKELGEITEAGVPVVRTINDLVKDIETNRLFSYAAKNSLLSTDDAAYAAEKGWVQLSDTQMLGNLKGRFVPEAVADDINYMQRIASESENLYQKMLSVWKFTKVPMNPATISRNLMNNAMLLDFSGVPLWKQPGLLSVSMEQLSTHGDLYQLAKQTGAIRGTFSQADMKILLQGWEATQGGMLERLVGSSAKKGFNKIGGMYQKSEEVFKLAKFIDSYVYQGLAPEVAAREAQKWLFNYQAIPSAVRTAKTTPFLGSPFITYQYKAFPRVFETAVKNPLKIAKYIMLFEGLEEYAIQKHGLTETQVAQIKKHKPGVMGALPSFQYILPFKDSTGRVRSIDMAFTYPFGEVGEFGAYGTYLGFLGTPEMRMVEALVPGKKSITPTGRELQTASEKIEYLAQLLLPPLVPPGYAGKRLKAAAEGRTDRYGVPYDYWLEVARNVFGVKTEAFDPAVEGKRMQMEIEFIQSEYSHRTNRVRRDQSLTYAEKEGKIEAEVSRAESKLKDVMKKYKLMPEDEADILWED